MPRLLPRLLKAIKETHLSQHPKHLPQPQDVISSRSKSLYRPLPEIIPSFSHAGRTRSIMLDENPITDKRVFTRHKRLPPRVRLDPRTKTREGHDPPREMTREEREWWSSPYLRMLSSPLRQCAISRKYLPKDFLISLAMLRLPAAQGTRNAEVLVPDGLEHPKFKRRKARISIHVSCWKEVFQTMKSPVSLPRMTAKSLISKNLCAHINHLLRLRVLQELNVLTDALGLNRRQQLQFEADADPTILRRLTRAEFKALRETGILPYPDAVAVLVVPPVNRNPKTKERPQPSQEPEIPSDTPPLLRVKPPPPLSTLHKVRTCDVLPEESAEHDQDMALSTFLPKAQVPLYNGVALFPSPSHRAALHEALTKLLDSERHFRGMRRKLTESRGEQKRAHGDERGSHAFLLTSSEQAVKRADTAPLAIALWRLRMWEGDSFTGKGDGWEIGKEWRLRHTQRLS